MQAVFKVKLPPSTNIPQEKPFVPRREHKKSRGGCIACKKRRIKVHLIRKLADEYALA